MQLTRSLDIRTVLAVGMSLTAAGLIYFSQVSVGGSYVGDLAPGFVLAGIGLGFSFVPVTIAALVGVEQAEAGIASGIINTSQQIGGALGTAVLSTVAFTRAADYATSHAPTPQLPLFAAVDGYSAAFLVGAILAIAGVVATLTMVPGGRAEELVGETEPAAA